MKKLNQPFKELLNSKKFLIMLHRGSHGGNIIENTTKAVNLSHRRKVDIVEIDIVQSTDGDFFVFHDTNEPRLLQEERNINTLSTEEIEACFYHNDIGHVLHQKVEKLEDLLKNVEKEVFINLDRSWEHWETFIPYLDNFEEWHQHFILKSPVKREYLDILEKHEIKYMYMPIVYNEGDLDIIESYENINFVGFEVIEKSDDFSFILSERFDKYKEENYLFLANAINLDDDVKLFSHLDDETAILGNPEDSWGKMLELGINAIQTDWSDVIYEYRQTLS